MKPIAKGALAMGWRVFWVPTDAVRHEVREAVLPGWRELSQRQAEVGVRAGDPIFLGPDHRVDAVLSLFTQSRQFRAHTKETKRNYVTDIALYLDFLLVRGVGWRDAGEGDLRDFEDWRRFAPDNPRPIGPRSGTGSSPR
ncbi:hypothetical protein ACFV4P_13325 [Kitasatospora sp. NPDC059795]|uniref:hypothetical protein n=1 Tax=Kitasatospora sp. NPDC059795 TaxID=3346949 RepID=UPI003664ECC2